MHGEGTHRQTDKQTDGHGDSMTESAQWANSVKIKYHRPVCRVYLFQSDFIVSPKTPSLMTLDDLCPIDVLFST